MIKEHLLYFIKQEYYDKYEHKDNKPNKGENHGRPCYYSFKEDDIIWMVPISSQVQKYQKEYDHCIKKYGICDTMEFIYVKGNKNVALIQNMIPCKEKYIDEVYKYKDTMKDIELNKKEISRINAKVRKVLRLARAGTVLTFTPILEFESRLKEDV